MKKGSITVYLSLVLCVMVALIYTAIDSARYSCGRALLSMAADEGLFSLFGEYDRILYEKYGLLFIDGGYDTGELKAGVLLEEAVDYMEKNAGSGSVQAGLFSSDLFRIDIDEKSVTGYVLATDSGGEPLRQQIRKLMLGKTGADALGALYAKYSGASVLLETVGNGNRDNMEQLKAEYESQRAAAVQRQEEEEDPVEVEVPADFKNPIDHIYRLKRLGIMGWAVPDINRVSAERIDLSAMPSSRTLNKGMGMLPETQSSVEDRFFLAKYITDFFPCFTAEEENGLRYQAEYAIAGKAADVDNLKSVLNRLLLIREVLNAAYLTIDQEKQAEAYAAAAVISSVLLIPEFIELVKGILILCWAFGESMIDLKTLLAGGKVPLIKDASSWQLSLSDLASLSMDTSPGGSQSGFDYREYLCILLMIKSGDKLMSAVTDLLEYNRRIKSGENGFCIDTCVCSMEIQIDGCIGKHPYTMIRSYGYDT